MKATIVIAAGLLALAAFSTGQAQMERATEILKIERDPFPIFETADTASLIRQIERSDLANSPLPWPILDHSENGMYLIEYEGQRVWVVDSTVKVDVVAAGTNLDGSAMNFADPDLAGSRGYGD